MWLKECIGERDNLGERVRKRYLVSLEEKMCGRKRKRKRKRERERELDAALSYFCSLYSHEEEEEIIRNDNQK